MKKIVILLAIAALFLFQGQKTYAQENLENIQATIEEESSRIESGLYTDADINEVMQRLAEVDSAVKKMVAEKTFQYKPQVIKLQWWPFPENAAYCNLLNEYGWVLQVVHDVILGKVLPYQSCIWYLYQLAEETLIWCPSTCQCNLNIWCAFHQYQRLKAIIGITSCQS